MESAARALLEWYRRNARDLPWRRTRDPYRIWISEIMAQQTRIETVLGYYDRFLTKFPSVEELAGAAEPEVLEAWAGLGYYRRARQLHAAAKQIHEVHGGRFPGTFEELRALPGIGDYTAAAIGSIAFDLPHVVVDGNVLRVFSRLTDEPGDIGRTPVRNRLRDEAQTWLDTAKAGERGDFNQSLMELGAVVCAPRSAQCLLCPVRSQCRAFRAGTVDQRPVKAAKQTVEKLELVVALVRRGSSLLIRRRPDDEEIMPGFWEAPQVSGAALDDDCLADLGIELGETLGEFRHAITYRAFRGRVFSGNLQGRPPVGYQWVAEGRLQELPVATITRKAIEAAKQAL